MEGSWHEEPRDREPPPGGIAIVGLAGRFPGAATVAEFWSNIRDGVSTISLMTDAELEDAYGPDIRHAPNFVRARAILSDVEMFDAGFFGMTAAEAKLVDPQHRVFLECAWEALEDAGYDPDNYGGAIGVFAGCSPNSYLLNNVTADRDDILRFTSDYQVSNYPRLLGAGADFLSTRISYKLGLRGPSFTLQTACSTSLVAIAQACQSLLCYGCDMALAGGVSITLPQKRGYLYQEGGMVSADGTCRTFDARADGTVFGAGSGIVLLKRVEDALADGDQIHAVIIGSAVNNDGASKIGFTAPSIEGQAAVIAMAQEAAGIDPRSISYIECHGTGTPLGDPIEVAALTQAFRLRTDAVGFCALGSVKPNVGHLDAAAGVTGLIKATLALGHRQLPPVLHFERPNPAIELEGSPFFVNARLQEWEDAGGPRRAGVSAFGVGGTNAHLVLQEAPERPERRTRQFGPQLLVLSARSEAALAHARSRLADALRRQPDLDLADVAHTLQTGRRAFAHRAAFVCADVTQAYERLEAREAPGGVAVAGRRVVFMFPGQGAQHAGMAARLHQEEPQFRRAFDNCAEILRRRCNIDLPAILWADDPAVAGRLVETQVAQPALFSVGYALASLWIARGIRPDAMIGHSVGEFVAACLAGVLSLEDALCLVAERGRLMQALPPGGMLVVRLGETALRPLLHDGIEIAAINGPSLCVLAGPEAALVHAEAELAVRKVASRRLQTSHAFHSAMVDPVVAPLAARLGTIALHPPTIPIVSCVTGAWLTNEQATSADYWARHCREPVRFADGLTTVMGGAADAPAPILIEVGPGITLRTLALQGAAKGSGASVLASLPGPDSGRSDTEAMLEALGLAWAAGAAPDWTPLHVDAMSRRVSLPTYPFERSRHWIDRPAAATRTDAAFPPAVTDILDVAATPDRTIMTTTSSAGMRPDPAAREARVAQALRAMIEELSGEAIAPADLSRSFLELGFDSLFLSQVTQQIQTGFGLRIRFRQLLGDLPSIPALASFIAAQLPEEAPPPQAAASATPVVVVPVAPVVAPGAQPGLEGVLQAQLATMSALMTQQLELLRGGGGVPVAAPVVLFPAAPEPLPPPLASAPSRLAAFAITAPRADATLTPAQQTYLQDLVRRTTARTGRSKSYTATHRTVLADPRAAAGFRVEWKEMVYPIVAERAAGALIWDLDGNEYVDLVNGFGQTFFGHSPDFVVQAVTAQLGRGFAIGPQADLVGEVASLFSELTGNARVTFCNTGSEAVMAAMRLARTVTGRRRIVVFSGSYHGQFDEVLVKGGRSAPKGVPAAAGIPPDSVGSMVVLEYGAPESLDWIRQNAGDLAAVIVEPVQSRHPALRPRDFLVALREITRDHGAALVFDEIVTGFRTHPGGMQAVFDIRADLATYGKVVGGGLPIGVLAGTPTFMDALDGGAWDYGDDSSPEVGVTFFAGTFVRHPLVLAAAHAVLLELKARGPSLQEGVAARTQRLVGTLNRTLQTRGLQTRVEGFSSWFYFTMAAESANASLLYYELRNAGYHIQEGFPCFVTTAHTDAQLDRFASVFEAAVIALQDVGLLPGGSQGVDEPAAEAVPSEIPLTEPQIEIWLSAQQGDAASCSFNESVSLHLSGPVDEAALVTALDQVVARHDALRARFGATGEAMLVSPSLTLHPVRFDLSARPPGEAAAAFDEIVARDAMQPFDLASGPLIRAILVRRPLDATTLVLTAHHIVCDGWSIGIILSELSAFYAAARNGTAPELDAVLPFARYAIGQAARDPASRAATEAFWLRLFANPPAPVELPTDRPRGAGRNFEGATERYTIGVEALGAVKRLGATQGCTLFVTLLAAFELLVGRLADAEDVVVAVPAAGQLLVEDRVLVGHCVNLLPIRARWTGDATVQDHLAATRQAVLDAYEHQDYTLGTLVRALRLPRVLGRLPITAVQFNLERWGDGMSFPGLDASVAANPKRFSNFDIFFNLVESRDGLAIECDYNTELFDRATIRRWQATYALLLERLVETPTAPLGRIALASGPAAHHRREPAVTPAVQLMHGLFTAQAGRTPDAVAATFAGASLTYGELDRRTSRLAHALRRQIGPGEARVAIMMDRSLGLLVGLLGVLKAGYTYVPLDPRHPAPRLEHILRDSEARAVLVSAPLPAALSGLVPVVVDMKAADGFGDEPDTPPVIAPDPEALAYICYTSGSTGLPKGVCVRHRSVANFLVSMAEQPGMDAGDVLPAITTVAFDIAVLELFLPLGVGARVVIVDTPEIVSGTLLLERMARERVTVMQATPTSWQMLLDAGFVPHAGLRMLCGGEPLPRALADRLLVGGGALWNMYGPTETTIWSSLSRVEPAGPITIGGPIAQTSLQVLDRHGQVALTGVAGELVIGGAGVAAGYRNRPELTAEKFVSDPAGGTMFRTGDLARVWAGGGIELLGRIDQQIKLRGFRIEIGEIEAVAQQQGELAAVAVALREDSPGLPILVGYFVERPGQSRTGAQLRAALARHLPDYMIPGRWVRMEVLPVTANGKLDRKALPAPDQTATASLQAEVPRPEPATPTSDTETALSRIWAEVLRLPVVGIDDDLFDLGADSIQLFQITARSNQAGLRLMAKDLLEHRTIARICRSLAEQPVAPEPLREKLELSRFRRPDAVPAGQGRPARAPSQAG